MNLLQNILILFLMLFSSTTILAQKDSIALQRKARKMVRQGNELYQKKQYTEASVAYRKALDKSSYYDKASYNLGNALYENKNFKEATPQYELSAKTASDKYTKAEAYHNLGNSMMETKNYQGAVDAYKNSLRNNPNDDETRYNLAVAQEFLEKEKQQILAHCTEINSYAEIDTIEHYPEPVRKILGQAKRVKVDFIIKRFI